jgi:hypothetical protein
MMATMGLELIIPEGIITYPRKRTANNLVWGNTEAENLTICCGIAEKDDHSSDYLQIEITLDLTPCTVIQEQLGYNLNKAN